jgi:hypothetical protein
MSVCSPHHHPPGEKEEGRGCGRGGGEEGSEWALAMCLFDWSQSAEIKEEMGQLEGICWELWKESGPNAA